MLICVPDVLSKAEVADFRGVMDDAAWEDGRSTAGSQSAEVKKNEQLPPNGETSRTIGRTRHQGAHRQPAVCFGRDPAGTSFRRCSTATASGSISAFMLTTPCGAII